MSETSSPVSLSLVVEYAEAVDRYARLNAERQQLRMEWRNLDGKIAAAVDAMEAARGAFERSMIEAANTTIETQ